MLRRRFAVAIVTFILTAAAANAQAIRKVQSSGEQWSGEGKQYSGWYVLRSDPPPPGYYLAQSAFTLVGDRACGSWAECREIARSPYGVTWEFRMQGHDESRELTSFFIVISDKPVLLDPKTWPRVQVTLSGKKATSMGVLELVYRPEHEANLPQTITWTRRREEWSGHGDQYSAWYDITSEPTPFRYTLSKVDFRLDGDRVCGSWAECGEVRRDANGVTWHFRMQGHSEQIEFVDGAIRGKAATSTGVLTTTYTLTNPPAPAQTFQKSRASLKQNVKWAIAHEGCSLFTHDARTSLDEVRTCFMAAQAHNSEGSYQISAHDDATLTAVINESTAEIKKEITENFRWVCEHEREAPAMRQFLQGNDFDAIRRLYQSRQEHNPNTRNLLAAVPDSYLRTLVTQQCRR